MKQLPSKLHSLERGTVIYRNLMYHRVLILEPIRQMAFRNMRHLSRAITDLPKPENNNVNSTESSTWIAQIQDRMLKDQGVEPSDLNRILVHTATFTPVKLYLALLYAEIEYLSDLNDVYPLTNNTALSEFLQSQNDFIEPSKQFRHGILHPNEQSTPWEEAWVLSGFQNELPEMQRTIDSIADGLRATLRQDVESALKELPGFQQWHCYWGFLTWLSDDEATLLNDATYSQLNQEIDRMGKEYERICLEADSTALTPPQLETNKRVFQCMANLHLPGTNDVIGEVNVQPKMNVRLFKRVEFSETAPPNVTVGDRYLNNVVNNLPNYNFIIDGVGVLLNETLERVPIAEGGAPQRTNDRILSAMEHLTFYERQTIAGQSKVCVALLYGLVQAYQNIRKGNPQIANQSIDNVIDNDAVVETIGKFRNIVFHVADPKLDPYQLDDEASYVAPEAEEALFTGLSMFLGIHFCVRQTSWVGEWVGVTWCSGSNSSLRAFLCEGLRHHSDNYPLYWVPQVKVPHI